MADSKEASVLPAISEGKFFSPKLGTSSHQLAFTNAKSVTLISQDRVNELIMNYIYC